MNATVRDRFLKDLLYYYRRQHIIRDQAEYLMVSAARVARVTFMARSNTFSFLVNLVCVALPMSVIAHVVATSSYSTHNDSYCWVRYKAI